ncbi:MAG TPA: 3-hydroxyacyl-CoA dehydrogenase NAD-binding domain-containing protein [Steroidobacteraceae bacterium]|nr:3-hydroxyacyl-CoA dehydrogenase NAD-binding domain-containing protein [Steroidobacteraceae bacterium]
MSTDKAWRLDREASGLACLTLDRPGTSANSLSRAVLLELGELLRMLQREPPRGLLLRSGKSSGFIAGADVREFTRFRSEADALETILTGQQVFDQLEALPCPTVAAIQGFALGGGLELALACRYRVGVDDARLSLGLPEVQLGIHPGFGGTVRAVRLLGVRAAMELMLTGKPVRADRARAMGLIDRLVSAADLEAAARQILADGPPRGGPPFLDRLLNLPGVRSLLRSSLEARVAKHARRDHYPAPYAIIDLWVRYGARGRAAYEAEAHSIARLFSSETARSLVRMFLLQDRLKALGGKPATPLKRVHVIGAGVMGGDIAAWCALRGLEVTLQDREQHFVDPALKRAADLFAKRLRDPAERSAALARLRADVPGAGVGDADILIEAIFENLEAKRALYAQAEPRLGAAAVLASNTSSITLELLAEKLLDPGRLVGLHFFNPVAQMPLVEVIHSAQTKPEPLAAAMAFARRIDKLPLPCRSGPGFLVNRVLFPYLHEALYAAGEGVPLGVIDRAAVDFGMPMGPIELSDVVGLDVIVHVGEIITRELGREMPPYTQRLRDLVAARKLGRKSGEGFYRWQEGKPVRPPAPAAAPEDLADRLILALLNECAACLREQVVADADLLDAGVVFGTGFAPFRGGPLNYARTRGIGAIVARLTELEQRHGKRFHPDAGWGNSLC